MQEEKLNEIYISQSTADKLKKLALDYKKLLNISASRFSSDSNT